jgi:hypothetical protein
MATDEVTVIVNAAPNQGPDADAGRTLSSLFLQMQQHYRAAAPMQMARSHRTCGQNMPGLPAARSAIKMRLKLQ